MNHVPSLFGARLDRRTTIKGMLTASMAGASIGIPGRAVSVLAHDQAAAYPEVVIGATEYAFEMPATIAGGWNRLTLDNQGAMDHHAMFMRVNDDATVEDVQAALLEPSLEPLFAVVTIFGGPEVGPGAQASVILDLEPGTYVVICAIPDAQGVPHYALGMQTVVEVTAPVTTLEAPATVAKVELMEMMFHGMEDLAVAPGPQVWEVVNAGTVAHELVVLRLQEGFTFEQFQAMMTAPPDTATPVMDHATPDAAAILPVTLIGGAVAMDPGLAVYPEFDFTAGDHVAICYVPGPEGVPHFALGMLMPFTVA